MRCQWPNLSKGTPCTFCGYTLRRDYDSPPNRICGKPPGPCRHLGEDTGSDVEQLKCGCAGAKMTAVFECALHDICAPLARVETLKDERVKPCRFCADRSPSEQPSHSIDQTGQRKEHEDHD